MKQTKQTKNSAGVATALCSLLLLVASCEQADQRYGEPVEVRFSMASGHVWNEETLTRNASDGEQTLETVTSDLDGDWQLEASLVEEPAAPTRADGLPNVLVNGTKIWIIAYTGTGADASTYSTVARFAQYTYHSGALTPVAASPFLVTSGESYRFVAYAYNSASQELPYSDTETNTDTPYEGNAKTEPVSLDYDLLWGQASKTITATNCDISIPLVHQFSGVRYDEITVNDGATLVSGSVSATLRNNYRAATLKKWNGMLIKSGIEIPQTILEKPSNYTMVYTGNDAQFYVQISGTLNTGGSSTANFNALLTFSRALQPGNAYLLKIVINKKPVTAGKTLKWAGSNIYWDGTRLTFDPAGERSREQYQGVLFKWGSLVGMPPALTNGIFSAGTKGDKTTGTPIYVPDITTGQWEQTNTATKFGGTGTGETAWNPIPCDSATRSTYGADKNHLDELGTTQYSAYKGDICRYISEKQGGDLVDGTGKSKYRMPAGSEFGTPEQSGNTPFSWGYYGWTKQGTSSIEDLTTDNADGRAGRRSIPTYGQWANTSVTPNVAPVIFPASGGQGPNGMYNTNRIGAYWAGGTASPSLPFSCALHINFDTNLIYPFNIHTNNTQGFPVRCILRP